MSSLTVKYQKLIALLALICFCAICIYMFNTQLNDKTISNVNQSTETKDFPSAYIKQAYIQSYDKSGRIEFQVRTPELEQFSNKNIMILATPKIDYKANHHYKITAEVGTLINKKNLLLERNAVIKKANSAQSMKSESFNINLPDKIITSQQKVVLKSVEGITTANGMNANINNQIVKLTNRVRGIYEP